MLKLAAEKTRGAVPYNTNPQHTAEAAKILGPGKWLAIEQKVTLETDPAKARALGRKELARYMMLDNYRNNLLRHRLYRGGSGERRFRSVHRCDGAVGRRRQGEAGTARAFRCRRDACRDPAGARRGRYRGARCDPDGAGGYVERLTTRLAERGRPRHCHCEARSAEAISRLTSPHPLVTQEIASSLTLLAMTLGYHSPRSCRK